MENAAKALLIAGGVLLTMLVVSLLIFSWGRFSEFYNNQDELKELEDVAKFNQQFSAYENRKVHGYELISLANKVADYNMRYSDKTGAQNDKKYTPITMKFNITTEQAESFQFKKDPYDVIVPLRNLQPLFKKNEYIQSNVKNDIVGDIWGEGTKIEDIYGSADIATRLAKSINVLILSKDDFDSNRESKGWNETASKRAALDDYNFIVEKEEDKIEKYKNKENWTKTEYENTVKKDYQDMINKLIVDANIMHYYEYYQFKKAIFKCKEIQYDSVSNRISYMEFYIE